MSTTPREPLLLSRRRCLELGALGGAAAVAAPFAKAVAAAPLPSGAERKRVLRFAHLTDVHIEPELKAAAGAAQCLHHAQSLAEPAELIVTGGDVVFDVFGVDQARTDLLAKLWRDTLKNECSLPVRAAIGNHDIRPWGKSDAVGGEGKAWAVNFLGIERRYYAFDQAGWRFIVLDTVQPDGDVYTGKLDAEQRAWLETELKQLAGAKPVVIVSHIPILTLTTLIADNKRYAEGEISVPASWMLQDGTSIHELLREHANVKLCLSGHMHLLDRCELDGVTYLCGGAVCANWWKGPRQKVDEGYGLVDLFDDGHFDYAYTPYGWNAEPA